MQESDSKVMRGVSIAVIILSVLGILGSLIIAGLFVAGGMLAGDSSFYDGYVEYREETGSGHGIDSEMHLDSSQTAGLVSGILGFLGAFAGVGTLLCVVSLVAGVLGLRNSSKPEKMGLVTGWSIAGAVCALLMLRIVTCVLLIVNVVYARRLRRGAQDPMYSQPMYTPPMQGQPQPQPQPQQFVQAQPCAQSQAGQVPPQQFVPSQPGQVPTAAGQQPSQPQPVQMPPQTQQSVEQVYQPSQEASAQGESVQNDAIEQQGNLPDVQTQSSEQLPEQSQDAEQQSDQDKEQE